MIESGNGRAAWLPCLAAIALGGVLGCTALGSLDLPLMLANGERILTDGAIPRTNVFSWTNPDHAYLNDKWLFMVLVAAVDRAAGVVGLAALKIAFGGALAGLLFALARRGASPGSAVSSWRACGVALLGVTMLSYRLHLRAEWVSYLGAAWTLLLLPGLLRARFREVVALLVSMPIWAATHGYWVLGPLLVAAAALGARSWRGLVVAAAAAGAAAVSPYGAENVLHPVRVALQLGGSLSEAITELRTPFAGDAPVTAFHALAVALTVVAGVALVERARDRRFGHAAVLLVVAVVAWRLDRNLALLGLVPPLAIGAGSRPGGAPSRALRGALSWGAALSWGGGLVWSVVVVGLVASAPWGAGDRRFGPGAHAGRFPETLAAALPDAWRGERYVNDLSIGSWLVRARGSAFIDGNTEGYPPAFLASYRALLSGESSVESAEREFRPDGWFLRTSAATTRVLVLGLFLDGRRVPSEWDDVATLFRGAEATPDGAPDADAAWRRWLGEVYLPRARAWFPGRDDALAEARAALPVPLRTDDVALLRAALLRAPWEPSLYRDLARAYDARGDALLADRCRAWAYRIPDPGGR